MKVSDRSKIWRRVWSLWDEVEQMAAALDESVTELRRLRGLGKLPAPRHDRMLLARAVWKKVRLTRSDLQNERDRDSKLIEHTFDARKRQIGGFYDAVGGVDVAAARTGASANSLYIAKSRGRLQRSWKHELTMLAQERGVDLNPELFEPVG